MQRELFGSKNSRPWLLLIAGLWLLIALAKGLDPADELSPGFGVHANTTIVTTAAEPLVQPAEVTAAATEPPAAAAQPVAVGDVANGQMVFGTTCAACHGPTGEGVQGLGKDLTTSDFVVGLSDGDLLAFIKQGRDMSDPLNTTGIAMPPKGGNPAIQDAQIQDIIAFMRSIHK